MTNEATMTNYDILIRAASYIEQGHYHFLEVNTPQSCDDVGCVLGWVAFAAGLEDHEDCDLVGIEQAAEMLGFAGSAHFYVKMNHLQSPVKPDWHYDAQTAADLLRYLADKEYSHEPDQHE